MAYVSQEMKSKLAPTIKKICAKYGIKATLAVHNHSSLVLNIKSGKIDFIKNYNETSASKNLHRQSWEAKDHMNVNTSWFQEYYTGTALDFLKEVVPAMKGPDYFDHSDSMTDYFHRSHYIDINVGKWDKPYVLEAS